MVKIYMNIAGVIEWMLTNEKYNFPVFILIDGINVCKITWQLIPYTIDFMRITTMQSIVTNPPQILKL